MNVPASSANALSASQRITAHRETRQNEAAVKLVVERYDENLGWYAAGGMTFPLHQLPLLQQALDSMSNTGTPTVHSSGDPKIIPFPGLQA